jgi:hypothetical protein
MSPERRAVVFVWRRRQPPPAELKVDDASELALQAMLAEYATLRAESVQSISNRMAVMNFTFGALSVVLAGLLAASISELMAGFIALFFVPQMAKAGLLIWMGEYNRSQRAGRWTAVLEERINQRVGSQVVGWEGSLASAGAHMSYPYAATVLFILGIGYAGSLLGLYFFTSQDSRPFRWLSPFLIVALTVAYIFIVEGLFLRFVRSRWREVRTADPPSIPVD